MPFESVVGADFMRFIRREKGVSFGPNGRNVAVLRQEGAPLKCKPRGKDRMAATDRLDFRSYQAEAERHSHGFWQVVLPVEGRLDLDVEGRGGRVEKGRGALIPPGSFHAFEARARNRFLVADLESLSFDPSLSERIGAGTFFPVRQPVQALIDYRAALPIADEAIGYWCGLLLLALAGGTDGPVGCTDERQAVRKAQAYMDAHLSAPLTIGHLCRETGLAAHRLTRAFRRELGESPYAHLTARRVQRALDLLQTSDLGLSEIAALAGFSDQSAMTRHMRRKGLESPGASRRLATRRS